MKPIYAAFGIAALCVGALGAQSSTTETKTKVEVKEGKEVHVSGCLDRNAEGTYLLTTSDGDLKYALVTDDDLSKHIGHRIEVKGKAADKGDGKVKTETSVGTSGSEKVERKTEVKGTDLEGMRYLGVKSVKMIADSCK